MAEYSGEEYALGFEDCRCPFDAESNDHPCVSCGKRVTLLDHVHFKGELYHDWCLLIAALKQARG